LPSIIIIFGSSGGNVRSFSLICMISSSSSSTNKPQLLKHRTYRTFSLDILVLFLDIRLPCRMAEVCSNQRRWGAILIVLEEQQSLVTLAWDDRPDPRYQPSSAWCHDVFFTTRNYDYIWQKVFICGNRINVYKGPRPDHLVLPTPSDSLDAGHPPHEHLSRPF
jgi:hypothetical protein